VVINKSNKSIAVPIYRDGLKEGSVTNREIHFPPHPNLAMHFASLNLPSGEKEQNLSPFVPLSLIKERGKEGVWSNT